MSSEGFADFEVPSLSFFDKNHTFQILTENVKLCFALIFQSRTSVWIVKRG